VDVLFTPAAERQVHSLHHYIAERAGEAVADGYIQRIIAFCQGLATYPLRGRPRDDVLPGLRTIGFERRATIAFVVTAEAVLIEGIFYAGRDFERLLRRP
jgi:toxin ParE1/3/4